MSVNLYNYFRQAEQQSWHNEWCHHSRGFHKGICIVPSTKWKSFFIISSFVSCPACSRKLYCNYISIVWNLTFICKWKGTYCTLNKQTSFHNIFFFTADAYNCSFSQASNGIAFVLWQRMWKPGQILTLWTQRPQVNGSCIGWWNSRCMEKRGVILFWP